MNRNAEIDRKHIFYTLENSSSMLPMERILLSICSYQFIVELLILKGYYISLPYLRTPYML